MGLDMYLSRQVWICRDKREGLRVDVPGVDPMKIQYIEEEAMYWRKSNAIHRWFVDNVQDGKDDCGNYWVPKKKLQELLDIVTKISEEKEKAGELLPTQFGFFFGSYDYDEWYFEDLKSTKIALEEILARIEVDEKNKIHANYYYHSSW